ncbi:MAG TPA: ABC transporter ATP-binding protein [Kofleriaceae bacterium]|nr:ABC transporter ATP-binding protein [Kofleriaceae bacterium]
MLELAAVTKMFGRRRALDRVTLAVAPGEAVLLVGRNGAGKTTLLRVATGYLDPDAGSCAVGGIDLARDRARAQAGLGYLPEHAPAPPELTVRAHLASRARLKRCGPGAVERAMAQAAVASEADRRIGVLSKGYRQRVGLADALLGDPPVLVLDEPTSGMDPIQTRELRDQLAAAAEHRAVLVSSHAVADLEAIASRVAVLRDGALVAVGSKAELCERAGKPAIDEAVIALIGAPGAAA